MGISYGTPHRKSYGTEVQNWKKTVRSYAMSKIEKKRRFTILRFPLLLSLCPKPLPWCPDGRPSCSMFSSVPAINILLPLTYASTCASTYASTYASLLRCWALVSSEVSAETSLRSRLPLLIFSLSLLLSYLRRVASPKSSPPYDTHFCYTSLFFAASLWYRKFLSYVSTLPPPPLTTSSSS